MRDIRYRATRWILIEIVGAEELRLENHEPLDALLIKTGKVRVRGRERNPLDLIRSRLLSKVDPGRVVGKYPFQISPKTHWNIPFLQAWANYKVEAALIFQTIILNLDKSLYCGACKRELRLSNSSNYQFITLANFPQFLCPLYLLTLLQVSMARIGGQRCFPTIVTEEAAATPTSSPKKDNKKEFHRYLLVCIKHQKSQQWSDGMPNSKSLIEKESNKPQCDSSQSQIKNKKKEIIRNN